MKLLALHGRVAFAAIHGTVVLRLERNLGGRAAVGANRIVHYAGTAGVTLSLVRLTALTATSRFILKTLFGIEFLLASSEHEFLTAIAAHQRLVLIHGLVFPLNKMNIWLKSSADLIFDPTLAGGSLALRMSALTLLSRRSECSSGRTYI
jgi:hypothetical protein